MVSTDVGNITIESTTEITKDESTSELPKI
jgi:hypothetical protein